MYRNSADGASGDFGVMNRAGLFTYPWDYVDHGVEEMVATVARLRLTHAIVASSYHAGFFLHPHNPRRKVYFVEDGAVYFHPDQAQYQHSPLKPIVSKLCEHTDWFAVICEQARSAGLEVTAWTVGLHNTPLGLAHPEVTIENAYGDLYPHALSPAHPSARKYVRALVADLAERYPVTAVLLEAGNYRRRAHGSDWVTGHHHERVGLALRPLEQRLLDVSFNEADVREAEDAGVDMQSLRRAIIAHLDRYFDQAPHVPSELPATVDAFVDVHPELAGYEDHTARMEARLLEELRAACDAHDVELQAPANATTRSIYAGGYGCSATEVGNHVAALTRQLGPGQTLDYAIRLGFILEGMGTPIRSQRELCDVVARVDSAGAEGIMFYNYAEAPRRCIQWIPAALRHCGFPQNT
jgi:hypothetical protein